MLDQCSTQDVLAYNRLICKPKKKMKRECIWHKLQEDKHNSSNKNKAWSFWHIILTFFSDTCTKPVFFLLLLFLLFWSQRDLCKHNQVFTCGSDIYVGSLSFYQSPPRINSKELTVINTQKCIPWLRGERFSKSTMSTSCHHLPSAPAMLILQRWYKLWTIESEWMKSSSDEQRWSSLRYFKGQFNRISRSIVEGWLQKSDALRQ